MAKAINLGTRLSLPRITLGNDPTPKQLAAAFEDLQRNVLRWSDALPFGSFGFHVRRTNNGASIANGATGILKWNAADLDMENWWNGGDQARFYCPPGGSGWYITHLNVYIGVTARSNWFPGVRRITVAGTVIPEWQEQMVSTTRLQRSGIVRLEEGEGIEVFLYNASGAAIVPTYAARDTTVTPYFPQFRIARFCLL